MGATPVAKYLDDVEDDDLAAILGALEHIAKRGLEDSPVDRRSLGKGLWELRIRAHRLFYCTDGGVMVLVHAYRKQGQKAPAGEIAVARQRMKEVLRE